METSDPVVYTTAKRVYREIEVRIRHLKPLQEAEILAIIVHECQSRLWKLQDEEKLPEP